MAKKKMDSLSRGGTGAEAQPVIETIAPHKLDAATTPPQTAPTEPVKADATPAATSAEPTAPVDGAAAEAPDNFDVLFPEPGVSISSPPSWIWWLVLLVLSVILAGVGYGILRHKINGWISVATPSPTAIVTATASATPVVTATAAPSPTTSPQPSGSPSAVAPSKVTLRVLNGTTTSGAAATAKGVLEKAGFTVRTTGNASSQTYNTTIVYYQAGRSAEADAVKSALTGYSVTTQQSTLANPDMVLVVIGKK